MQARRIADDGRVDARLERLVVIVNDGRLRRRRELRVGPFAAAHDKTMPDAKLLQVRQVPPADGAVADDRNPKRPAVERHVGYCAAACNSQHRRARFLLDVGRWTLDVGRSSLLLGLPPSLPMSINVLERDSIARRKARFEERVHPLVFRRRVHRQAHVRTQPLPVLRQLQYAKRRFGQAKIGRHVLAAIVSVGGPFDQRGHAAQGPHAHHLGHDVGQVPDARVVAGAGQVPLEDEAGPARAIERVVGRCPHDEVVVREVGNRPHIAGKHVIALAPKTRHIELPAQGRRAVVPFVETSWRPRLPAAIRRTPAQRSAARRREPTRAGRPAA